MTIETDASHELRLLQLADSAFPVGGFSHSWGLETFVQNGSVSDANEAFAAIEAILTNVLATQDAVACSLANKAARVDDENTFMQLNEVLSASRWAAEPLQASLRMGARFVKIAADALQLRERLASINKKESHHCTAFGWVTGLLGIDSGKATSAYLYASCANLVSASVRLIPLGQTDGQRILSRLIGTIESAASIADQKAMCEISSFSPMLEWASVEHETLYSRLFQS